VSQLYGERMIERKYTNKDYVNIVPNGVRTDIFTPNVISAENKLIIGGAGNLSNQKRFDVMIEAFNIFYREAKKVRRFLNIELWIAGEGPDEPSLRDLVKSHKLEGLVKFIGYVKDMPSFYSSIDIFCMSSDEEAAPYALLEAMAAGLPSVVTRIGDLPYIIQEGKTGYVVDARSARDLADGLLKLISEPGQYQRMGLQARRRVVKEYSAETWNTRMKTVFDRYI